jgi:hypothetical protein
LSASVRSLVVAAGLLAALPAVPAGAAPLRAAHPVPTLPAAFSSLVVGGTTAPDGSWPYAAFVVATAGDGRSFSCTGSVISPTAVVTAAHCAIDPSTEKPFPPQHMAVGIGVHNLQTLKTLGQVFTPSAVSVNPAYNETTLDDDSAVLTLPQPTSAPPVRLATPAEIAGLAPGATVSIAGWGQITDTQVELQTVLMQADVQLGSGEYCKEQLSGFNPQTMLCTDVPNHGIGPCHGDSGGPLVAHTPTGDALIGLVDWGGIQCTDTAAAYSNMTAIGFWVASAAGIAPPAGAVAPDPSTRPVNIRRPFISGHPRANGTLVCHAGVWRNKPTGFEYSWTYNGRLVAGLHSSAVLLGPGIHSGWAHCRVRAQNTGGKASASSRGVHIHHKQ